MMNFLGPAATVGSAAIGALASGGGGKDPVADIDEIYGRNRADWVRDWAKLYVDQPMQEYYPGETLARLNPRQDAAWRGMTNFANTDLTSDLQARQGIYGLAGLQEGIGALRQMGDNAPQFSYDQDTFDTTMGNLMPGLQGQYDAATRDIGRDLNFNTLPGIDMRMAGAGGFGDNRSDLMAGMATGMAQDRMADIGAGLYANAVNQAQSAAMLGGTENLAATMGNNQNMLQGYGNMAGIGLPGLGDAYQTSVNNFGLMDAAGQNYYDRAQSLINADIDRFNFDQNRVQNKLMDNLNYLHMMQGMTTRPPMVNNSPGMSPITGAMQGASLGLGLMDAFDFGSPSNNVPDMNLNFGTTSSQVPYLNLNDGTGFDAATFGGLFDNPYK